VRRREFILGRAATRSLAVASGQQPLPVVGILAAPARRRDLLLTAIAWMAVRPALSQQAVGGGPRRIGYLASTPPLADPAAKRIWAVFLEGLREYGWVEGQNLLIEGRWVEGHTERYGPYAAELVSRGDIELIVAAGTQPTIEAKTRTTTIPILMLLVSHPVGAGLVASLARPGGNVTGITNQLSDSEKSFELLRELVPDLHRVFLLWQSDNPGSRLGFESATKLATRLGLSLSSASLATNSDLEPALASIAADLPQALIVHPVPVTFQRRREIAAFAAAQHLPTFGETSEFARSGLLLSYGADVATIFRRAGFYVDRLLRGVKAAELPVEQPTKFELVINLKTAKAMGLTIPPSLIARADEVIE
jgi:putative ABC transport system substrate-binding protein